MKRILWLLSTIALICLAGCGETNQQVELEPELQTNTESVAPSLSDELASTLRDRIEGEIPVGTLSVDNRDVIITLSQDEDISHFGTYIVNTLNACKDIFGDESFHITLFSYDARDGSATNGFLYIYDGKDYEYGSLFDYRSGESVFRPFDTLDDLEAFFPAIAGMGIGSGIPDDELELYEQIWDDLNNEADTPEDEIFGRYTEQSGMTIEELKEWFNSITMELYT